MPNTTEAAPDETVAVDTAACDKTPRTRSIVGRPKRTRGSVRRLQIPGMRLTLSFFDLFHHSFHHSESPKSKQPVRATAAETSTPLAEMEDSVPTMGLWSGAMMLLALGFSSRNRLPHRQRAAGMAKRANRRCDA